MTSSMETHGRFRPEELAQHREFLCRLARGLLRDASQAEDVVQGAFAQALARPPRDARSLATWLRTVVRRLALNLRRDEERLHARERTVAAREARPATDEAAASLELQELVLRAVRALEEPYRTTLWLRYYENLGRKEIAARERVSDRTVQTRLARGLARLRDELDRRADGDRERWLSGLALLARRPAFAPAGAGLVGVGIMKKLVLSVAVLIVCGLVWRFSARAPSSVPAQDAPTAALSEQHDPLAAASAEGERVALAAVAPPAPGAEARGALRIRVRWSDGKPAPDIGLFVVPLGDPQGERHVQDARTDGNGLTTIDAIRAGTVRVEADRGAVLEAEVAAGGESEVVLDLPAATDVEGSVTDADGAPIGGAEILLVSAKRDWLMTRVVGHSDARGGYQVRAVDEDFAVSARAERYVPAFLQPLREPRGENWDDQKVFVVDGQRHVHADFVLDWIDFALRGVVLDPGRKPLAGARIAVGRNRDQGYGQKSGGTKHRLGMPIVRSDESGRFEACGVEHAEMPVAVMADGFPIQIASFPGWVGSVSYGEIVLDVPASIAGVVLAPDGAPVAGALVRVLAIRDRWAQDVPFPLPQARADERGRFRLELVAPGKVPIRVEPPAGRTFGLAFKNVSVAPGESAHLELRLAADDVIRGRALDAQGMPVADTEVSCTTYASSQRVTTGDDGRFEIEDCNAPPYRLELIEPGGSQAIASLTDVAPGPEEVVLTVPVTAIVTGVFLDDAGRVSPPPTAEDIAADPADFRRPEVAPGKPYALLWSPNGSRARVVWSADTFTFEHVPAGTYSLILRADARPRDWNVIYQSEAFAVRAGETLDLGVIRSQPKASAATGSLVLEVAPPGCVHLYPSVVRAEDSTATATLRDEDGVLRAKALAPGHYYVDVRANDMGEVCEPVDIRAGEEARVQVRLEPGTARTLVFPTQDPAASWRELRLSVKGSDGRVLSMRKLPVPFDDSHAVLVQLPVGRFSVEAETDTGLHARGTFAVLALSAQDAALVFELR